YSRYIHFTPPIHRLVPLIIHRHKTLYKRRKRSIYIIRNQVDIHNRHPVTFKPISSRKDRHGFAQLLGTLSALGVVGVLGTAGTAGAASRAVPAKTTALAPDGR